MLILDYCKLSDGAYGDQVRRFPSLMKIPFYLAFLYNIAYVAYYHKNKDDLPNLFGRNKGKGFVGYHIHLRWSSYID